MFKIDWDQQGILDKFFKEEISWFANNVLDKFIAAFFIIVSQNVEAVSAIGIG